MTTHLYGFLDASMAFVGAKRVAYFIPPFKLFPEVLLGDEGKYVVIAKMLESLVNQLGKESHICQVYASTERATR